MCMHTQFLFIHNMQVSYVAGFFKYMSTQNQFRNLQEGGIITITNTV